jgi:hypothetical protein
MKAWLTYFEHNCVHRADISWEQPLRLDAPLVKPLIHSMQRFQVGESGEGRHLRAAAALTNNESYIRAIDLFIKEEQEHARLMACLLKKLNAPLITTHWSDNCFILLRRLFRLHDELLVLLVPEIIAKRYFRAVHDGTGDAVVRAMCVQILRDEDGHVAFHIEYLQRAFASMSLPARAALRFFWKIVFRLACLVVIVDHRSLLRAVKVSPAQFWWDCELMFDETAAQIFTCAPTRNAAAAVLARVPVT